jgi:hypothetical protein
MNDIGHIVSEVCDCDVCAIAFGKLPTRPPSIDAEEALVLLQEAETAEQEALIIGRLAVEDAT